MQSRPLSDLINPEQAPYLPSGAYISPVEQNQDISAANLKEMVIEVDKGMESGGFPAMHRHAHLTGQVSESIFEQSPKWNKAMDAVKRNLKNPGAIVALVGPRGTGKTQMATVAGYEYAIDLMKRRRIANACRYIRAMEFFMAVKDAYSSSSSERDAFDPFTRPRFLVVDEVQVRNGTAWEDNALTFLLDTRYGAMKRTVLITNQTVEGFTASIGDSIASRICETGAIIACDWKSFREVIRT